MPVFTPDDIMAGQLPAAGEIVLYDDDHYYMGGVLAEVLTRAGRKVTLVTPSHLVSAWTLNTLEQRRIQSRTHDPACDAVFLVTAQLPMTRLGMN